MAAESSLQVFLFTDLVGSTDLKQRLGDQDGAAAIAAHDSHFRACMQRYGGIERSNPGDGFFATFPVPSAALNCALDFQIGLRSLCSNCDLVARVGIHMGESTHVPGPGGPAGQDGPNAPEATPKLLGLAVDTAGRVMGLALPGQILLTRHAFDSARQQVRSASDNSAVEWRAHGPYLFKGLESPIEVFEAGVADRSPLAPPMDSEKAHRYVRPGDEETLGWRPAAGLSLPGRDSWVLENALGQGGFGEVWLARHETTHDLRAFKFCFKADRLRSLKREMTLFRLMREVLGERNDIARLYDVRLDAAPFYLEMAYTEGGSLDTWAASKGGIGEVDMDLRIRIVVQIATALDAAHSVGVLHKDVKPQNVLISTDQQGKVQACLTDFGIGELMDRTELARAGITATGFGSTVSMRLEGRDSPYGTRLYTAPEIVAGSPPTILSDLYALGVLLYQCVVGDLKQPLGQGWESGVEDELIREDIALCVNGNPALRFSALRVLAERLGGLEERRVAREQTRRLEGRRLRRVRLRRNLFAGAGILAAAAVALAVVLWQRHEADLNLASSFRWRAVKDASPARRFLCAAKAMDLGGGPHALGALLAEGGRVGRRIESAWTSSRPEFPLCYSSDGEWLATAGPGRQVRLLRAEDASLVAELEGLTAALTSVSMEPAGGRLAGCDLNGVIVLWDLRTREVLSRTEPVMPRSVVFAWPADGSVIAAAMPGPDDDLDVRLFDAVTGGELRSLRDASATQGNPNAFLRTYACAFNRAASLLATGGHDKTVRVWDVATGRLLHRMTGHIDEIWSIAFAPDGRRLASGSLREIRTWDAVAGTLQDVLRAEMDWVRCLAYGSDGSYLASSGTSALLSLWDCATGREMERWDAEGSTVNALCFRPGNDQVASTNSDGCIRTWRFRTRELLLGHSGSVLGLALSPDESCLASASKDLTVRLWDPRNGVELHRLEGHTSRVWCVAFSPDGKWLASGSWDQTIRIWETSSGALLWTLRGHSDDVRSVAFSPDGSLLISGSCDKTVSVWSMPATGAGETPPRTAVLRGHDGWVHSIAFHPTGKFFASADRNGLIQIWDVATSTALHGLQSGAGAVFTLAFNHGGTTLAAGCANGTIVLWETGQWKETARWHKHRKEVWAVEFSPDDRRLASGAWDLSVRIWDVATGQEVAILDGHPQEITSVAWSQKLNTLTYGSNDNTIRQLDLSLLTWEAGSCYERAVARCGKSLDD